MHPISSLIPRLFPALLVITAAVLISQLLADDVEPVADNGGENGEGAGAVG